MFKLQSPSKYSPFDTIYLLRFFFSSKQFLDSSVLMAFSVSAVFYFTSFALAKGFPLRTFLIQGNKQKKCCLGREIRGAVRVGHKGQVIFGQKLLNTRHTVSRRAHKSPIMKWANTLSLQKPSLKLNTASQNRASWYTDTDGFLEHSPRGGSLYYKGPTLQKIIPVFEGSLLLCVYDIGNLCHISFGICSLNLATCG